MIKNRETIRTIFVVLVFILLFSAKYVFFIKDHSLENSEGDDKDFIIYGDKIARGELTTEDKNVVYSHIHKPLMIFIPMVLAKIGLIRHYLLLTFIFDMLLFAIVFIALNEMAKNTIIALGGSILASWNSLLGYYSFQYLPDLPLAASLIAFTYFLGKILESGGKDYTLLAGVFSALAVLFRIDSIIVILPVAAFYILKGRNRRSLVLAMLISLSIIAVYFTTYLLILENFHFDRESINSVLKGFKVSEEGTLEKGLTESKGDVFFIPYMLFLSFTPPSCLFAVVGIWQTYRKKGIFNAYLVVTSMLFIERFIIAYIGRGAQKYLTAFMPYLAVFAALGVLHATEAIAKRLKLEKTDTSKLTAILIMSAIISSYFWIHEPLPGVRV
ncbi:MAG: glycosyltransferase family 39 protein [Candidatus Altiarchaeota archaeon]